MYIRVRKYTHVLDSATEEDNSMDQKKIGAFIAQTRKDLNMSQKELADKLGVTDRAVSKWETGRSMPDLSLLQPLCRVLKTDVNSLLSGGIVKAEAYRKTSEMNMISLAEQNYLKSFRYGYTVFYPFAILLLIYCLIKRAESAGILSLIIAYSTGIYYFRYRKAGDAGSLLILICGIVGTITSLMGFLVRTW